MSISKQHRWKDHKLFPTNKSESHIDEVDNFLGKRKFVTVTPPKNNSRQIILEKIEQNMSTYQVI